MSDSHKGSLLQARNVVLPVDSNTVFLAHYDITANDVLSGISPIYNISSMREKEGIFGGGIAIEEGTTNIIPGGSKNMYPSYGNGHGTYNTNQYNNNQFFSIGTITSVENNIVTYVPARSLRTYDVVRPQTTGGGLTANTDYFIKAISPTQFTVHQYDSSQDGSKGFGVHDSIKNDVRIPINATNFPTMWHGAPHKPNSGLVKEIIPNGFSNNGIVHDCLRLYTNYRTDGVYDYMAYGVQAPITANVKYTYSFYYRAVTNESVGRTVSFSLHNGVGFGGGSFTLEKHWKRHEYTTSSTATGNASMYWNAGYGVVWDIAEIQCEQKDYATSFTDGTRSVGKLSYILEIDPNNFTLNFWAKSIDEAGFYFDLYAPDSNNRVFFRPLTTTSMSGGRVVNGTVHVGSTVSINNIKEWNMYTLTSNGTSMSIYQNGIKLWNGTIPAISSSTTHMHINTTNVRNFILDELRVDKIERTEKEISSWHLSNNPFYPKGIYRLAY